MAIPCCPNAVPTGGAGVASAPLRLILTITLIFFAIFDCYISLNKYRGESIVTFMYNKFNMAEGKTIVEETRGKGFDPRDIGLDDLEEANSGEFPGLSTEMNDKGEVVPRPLQNGLFF